MAFLITGFLLLLPMAAWGDALSGYADLTWSSSSLKTTDATGLSSRTTATSTYQRYNLMIDKSLYPKLRLNAAGSFEKDVVNSSSDDMESTSTNTRFRPWVTLTLKDPLYTAGIGYFLREAKQDVSQSLPVTTVSEDYNANFGWRPLGLPSLDLNYTKTNQYDTNRVIQDSTQDSLYLMTEYAYKALSFKYFGNVSDMKDTLHRQETQNMSHNGRGSYAGSFLGGRLNVSTSYNIIRNETTIAAMDPEAGGTVSIQQYPVAGLSTLSDTPLLVALDQNPGLIDGNLTATSGLNIGLTALGGETRARNMGVDFRTVTEVNNLLLWVDRELPQDIAASFSWDVYTSENNLNWTLHATLFPAPFGPFQNRFEMDFPNVKTRYLKLVVKPLQAGITGASRFPDILVTELQLFLKEKIGTEERKFTSGSETSNSSLRYRLLDSPSLSYDFSYYSLHRSPSGDSVSSLSNGLSASHRFNRVFSGTARVAREDGAETADGKRIAYIYNASLLATPLPTLTHSLVYSARDEQTETGERNTNSFFLNNTAQFYRGIDVSLNGGFSSAAEADGSSLKTTLVSLGANVVPHRTVAVNLYLTDTRLDQTRPGISSLTRTTRTTDLNLAYHPFPALYISAAMQIIAETDQAARTFQNYGLNWSPFRDGAFQFRFSYTETRRVEEQTRERIISPGLRYQINNRSFLDLSYQMVNSESPALTTETQSFTANLRLFL